MITTLPSPSRVPAMFPTTAHGAGTGAELVTSDGRALPLEATTLHAEVQGGLARYVLEQRYRNAYDETLHVVYRMPLPADGAVSGYAFEIGGRVIKGVVDRKRAARERFEEAIVKGHTAALLEQERADIFTQRIGNVPGGETIVARITVDQRLAWLPEGEWELRFPTVIGPRYCGTVETADDVRATHLKVTTQPLRVNAQLALTIRDAILGGSKPSSPTHVLVHGDAGEPYRTAAGAAGATITLAPGARLDRDLVVRWPVAAPEVGVALALARPVEGDAFGLVTIVPPARSVNRAPVARDLTVLLDTSGSMDGVPLTKAKQVVCMLLDSLAEQDRFELIEFSDRPSRYKREPLQATAQAKHAAIAWVRARKASGGTEMREGVLEALDTLRVGAQRQVIVVTDGYVGGEQQILEALHDHLPRSCRLHVLGVGDAVNRSLATQLSRAGRGVEVLVGSNDDAERGAKRLLDRTRAPMLVNVEVAGSALVRHAPEQLPDVFAGAPLVAGLVLRPEGGELIVRGEHADGTWVQTVRVPAQRVGEGNAAIRALYARELIADLEARSMLETVDARIEALGLEYQLATRLTSWIAVDETRVVTGAPGREVVIPQEVPHGTSAQAFGLRAGHPPMPMMMDAGEGGAAASFESFAGFDAVLAEPEEELARMSYPGAPPRARAATPTGNAMVGGPPAPAPLAKKEARALQEVAREPQAVTSELEAPAETSEHPSLGRMQPAPRKVPPTAKQDAGAGVPRPSVKPRRPQQPERLDLILPLILLLAILAAIFWWLAR